MNGVVKSLSSFERVMDWEGFYQYARNSLKSGESLFFRLDKVNKEIEELYSELESLYDCRALIQKKLLNKLREFDQQGQLMDAFANLYGLYQENQESIAKAMQMSKHSIDARLYQQLSSDLQTSIDKGSLVSLSAVEYNGHHFALGDRIVYPYYFEEDRAVFPDLYFRRFAIGEATNLYQIEDEKEAERYVDEYIQSMRDKAKKQNAARTYFIGAILIDDPEMKKEGSKIAIPSIVIVDEKGDLAKYDFVLADTTGGERPRYTGKLHIMEEDVSDYGRPVSIDSVRPY